MYNSKLIQVYQSLSKEEHFDFKKWLVVTKKSHHEDALKLFEYLYSRQNITAVSVQKERAFSFLYLDQKINVVRLRHVMSFALKSLEDFIKQNELLHDNFLIQKIITKSYRERGLKKYATQELEEAKKTLEEQPLRNASYYLNHYELELEQFDLSMTGARPTSTNLQEIIDGFSTFFMVNLLRYACVSISHQNLYKTTYNLPLLEGLLAELKAGNYSTIPTIQIYYCCYLSLTEIDSLEYFEKLKLYLVQYEQILSSMEYKELYTLAINYCIKRQNNGDDLFIQEAFDWYKQGIEKTILLDTNGAISRFTYMNTITLGLKLKKFEWTEAFIHQYAFLLPLEYRDSYLSYNLAKYHFSKKEYDKAMRLFAEINIQDLFINLDIKVMQLKIYYEQQSWEVLDSLIASFKIFFQRKSIMSYHKENYSNLIRFTYKLTTSFSKESLREEIEATNPLTERLWLLEQLQKK